MLCGRDVSVPRGIGIIRRMKHGDLVPDDLWEAIETFLPIEPTEPNDAHLRVSDCAALAGIIFVLKTGMP